MPSIPDPPAPPSRLLSLPPEIREEIYRHILHPSNIREDLKDEYSTYRFAPALVLFRINRQIHHEARRIFRELNTFVVIESPWPESQYRVANEGYVPIVLSQPHAEHFTLHSLLVKIDVPGHPMTDWEPDRFVIMLDDLPKFTQMWSYADLTHPGLNEHLRLILELRDPIAHLTLSTPHLSKTLQQRLLLPFGLVKGLHDTQLSGPVTPYTSIASALRASQAEPHPSPEHCLREATRLKLEGNAALKQHNYPLAIQHYVAAFLAIHIVIKGQRRHIHADAFFSRDLVEEPYRGKSGQLERLTLRVQLVANTCQAYLLQEDYAMCKFWGMRSIRTLREARGIADLAVLAPADEAVPSFPGADMLGKIYYRTALAYRALGDEGEARKLLRVAVLYLPRDVHVQEAVASVALKLG